MVEVNIPLDFEKCGKSVRVVHEVITPYTPQHNGTLGRRNRTTLNMIRSMMKEKKMTLLLGRSYFHNRLYTKQKSH